MVVVYPSSDLESWERKVREYEEQSGEVLSDSVKCGVLTASVLEPQLKLHLQMNAYRLTTYIMLRQELRDIKQAQTSWQGPVPMEIGAIGASGKYGKGKNKPTGKSKGKEGKGDDDKKKDVECFHCG